MSSYFKSRGYSVISTDFLCIATRLEKEVALHEPRLFECSNQTGRFLMTEVADFTQDDLDEDDVMLLDTWEEVGCVKQCCRLLLHESAEKCWCRSGLCKICREKLASNNCWLFYILSYSNPGVFKLVTRKINYKEKDKQNGRGLLQRGHQNWGFVALKSQKAPTPICQSLKPLFFLLPQIFLWIGNSANQYETQESYSSAVDYLKTHPAGRDPGTPITTVKQGYEPPTFTGWFNAWDAHKWSVSQTG